jgi:hypothetical protein
MSVQSFVIVLSMSYPLDRCILDGLILVICLSNALNCYNLFFTLCFSKFNNAFSFFHMCIIDP